MMTEQPAQSWNRREQIAGTYPAASASREPAQMPSEAVSTAVEMSISTDGHSETPLATVEDKMPVSVGYWPDSAKKWVSCVILQCFFFFFLPANSISKLGPLAARQPLAQGVCQLELLQQALFPSSITSPCPKEHAGMHHL